LYLPNSVTKNKGIQRKYMQTKGIIKKYDLYPDSEQQYRELKEAFERVEKPYTNNSVLLLGLSGGSGSASCTAP